MHWYDTVRFMQNVWKIKGIYARKKRTRSTGAPDQTTQIVTKNNFEYLKCFSRFNLFDNMNVVGTHAYGDKEVVRLLIEGRFSCTKNV